MRNRQYDSPASDRQDRHPSQPRHDDDRSYRGERGAEDSDDDRDSFERDRTTNDAGYAPRSSSSDSRSSSYGPRSSSYDSRSSSHDSRPSSYGRGQSPRVNEPGSDTWSWSSPSPHAPTTGGQHSGKGPKGYKRSDDRIVEDVSHELEQDGDVDASEIDVKCNGGVVVLRGTVDSREAKRCAERCAESVRGVKDVMNELKVQQSSFATGGDASSKSKDNDVNNPRQQAAKN